MRRTAIWHAGLLAAALCLPAAQPEAAGAAPKQADRAQLAGFAIGTARPSLALQVVIADGKVVSWAPATAGGDLRAVRSGSEAEPMLTVSAGLPVAIKFDLYLSQDGEHFVYTSSCAVTPGVSSFEMWQQPVAAFALGNPRVVADGKASCG